MKVIAVYLCGPMSGLADFNRPAFAAAAAKLRARGYRVINPGEFEPPKQNPKHADWMRLGIRAVTEADVLVYLPGADKSVGAQAEIAAARACGADVVSLREMLGEA